MYLSAEIEDNNGTLCTSATALMIKVTWAGFQDLKLILQKS